MEQVARVKRGLPLLMWRVGLIAVLSIILGSFTSISLCLIAGKFLFATVLLYFGWNTFFQNRKGFSFNDHFMATLVGVVAVVLSILFFVWI